MGLKLSVMVCGFPYAGNGACSAESPHVKDWLVQTALKAKADPRISSFVTKDLSDTPITMTRNRAIRVAKENGIDVLVMVDSDQHPQLHQGEDWYKPFWDEAFSFVYNNYHKGPRVIFAPYCGPPNGTENVYVFQWRTYGNHAQETQYSLEPYSREQSCLMRGIQEAAAGPTGMIMIDMRVLELIEPSKKPKLHILEELATGQITVDQAVKDLREGYFYYEWKDQRADEKASTEDVTFTRDLALAGQEAYGYNPVFCAWDSWIGHNKPWTVGRPSRFTTEQVGASLKAAIAANQSCRDVIIDAGTLFSGKEFGELNKQVDALLAASNVKIGRNPAGTPLVENVYETGEKLRIIESGQWTDHGHAPEEHQRVLVDFIRQVGHAKGGPVRVLEVGSWIGRTALAMANAREGTEVHCVDHWQGTPSDMTSSLVEEAGGPDAVYAEFCKTAGTRLNKTIFPWRGSSQEMSQKHWTPFDFIFIDGDHTYEGCKTDIMGWWKHLAPNGIMVGHDYRCHGYDGLVQAVQECFGEDVETAGWHPQGCLWVARKKNYPDLSFDIDFTNRVNDFSKAVDDFIEATRKEGSNGKPAVSH